MERRLILRGLLAGALAGLIAFGFARIFAEPQIQRAIDYESGRDAAQNALATAAGLAPAVSEPELFSRGIQADLGAGVALILFGTAMGALVAVVVTLCLGRVGGVRPRSLALLVAGAGLMGFSLVPFMKYPANPPSVGHPDTIRDRGDLYLAMVLATFIGLALAVLAGRRLAARVGNWNAALLAGAGFVAVIGVVMLALPNLGQLSDNVAQYGSQTTETPLPLRDSAGTIVYPGFPADLLWSFRLDSVLTQVILWAGIGLLFAAMLQRLLPPGQLAGHGAGSGVEGDHHAQVPVGMAALADMADQVEEP